MKTRLYNLLLTDEEGRNVGVLVDADITKREQLLERLRIMLEDHHCAQIDFTNVSIKDSPYPMFNIDVKVTDEDDTSWESKVGVEPVAVYFF